jgi:hypothetical protein
LFKILDKFDKLVGELDEGKETEEETKPFKNWQVEILPKIGKLKRKVQQKLAVVHGKDEVPTKKEEPCNDFQEDASEQEQPIEATFDVNPVEEKTRAPADAKVPLDFNKPDIQAHQVKDTHEYEAPLEEEKPVDEDPQEIKKKHMNSDAGQEVKKTMILWRGRKNLKTRPL